MNKRIKSEVESMIKHPPYGISCNFKDDLLDTLEANIVGPPDSPFEKGVFRLSIKLSARYPFEPPKVTFVTPIYHPNVDNAGRICLEILKMPPSGSWTPIVKLENVLLAIQFLMGNPNPKDPLMPDIAEELKNNELLYKAKAKEWTEKHAKFNASSLPLTASNKPECSRQEQQPNKKRKAPATGNDAENSNKRKSGNDFKDT